jgi:HAD superfamily hydrolase (TIGR01549 family)
MDLQRSNQWELTGRVATGIGQGAGFSQLGWAKRQFMALCGIDPFPGTLNLSIDRPADLGVWRAVKSAPGQMVRSDDAQSCDAGLYPVRINDSVPGAIVLPDIQDYAEDRVELIAAVSLREQLSLADGDRVRIVGQSPHPVRAAIFDVDGTLLNSLEGYRIAATRATEPYGYEVTYESVQQSLNLNQPFWDFIIPKDQPRDEAFIAKLRAETMRHWPAVMAEHVRALPGLDDMLERLSDAGVRLGIFTGSEGESLPCLERAGLLERFEIVVTRRDVERFKPDPQGLIQCLNYLEVDPREAAYVGDSRIDIQAGLAAGVMSIAVLTGAGDSASLSAAGAHRVLADIGALPDLFDLEPGSV